MGNREIGRRPLKSTLYQVVPPVHWRNLFENVAKIVDRPHESVPQHNVRLPSQRAPSQRNVRLPLDWIVTRQRLEDDL